MCQLTIVEKFYKYNHVCICSHCDDSESGLGDSESILSFPDPHTSKAHVDLSDMSTQTSQVILWCGMGDNSSYLNTFGLVQNYKRTANVLHVLYMIS